MPLILVVEDEWLIGEYLSQTLQDMGCQVVGPISTVAAALESLAATHPDGAILDVRLGGETSLAVADELGRRGIPFVFATGCTDNDLPRRFASRPLLLKPLSQSDLRSGLQGVLEAIN
ncbi:MAG: response regulator [Alphaproteobacteria bacterium]|nr:response regulator [Alphaproteobacteria bacterium]MBV9692059.1 response regulator [Alphaproteobacteria bacterium]